MLQAFLRALDQDLLLEDLLPQVLQVSLKDLTDPNSHFHPKDLQAQEVSEAQVDSLALLVLLKHLRDQEPLVVLLGHLLDQEQEDLVLLLHELL